MPACAVHYCRLSSTARQSLAFRGHDEQEGNFSQILKILKILSLDVPEMEKWLKGKSSYTHHLVQDEMLKLYGDATLRSILDRVHKSQSFAVVVEALKTLIEVSRNQFASVL